MICCREEGLKKQELSRDAKRKKGDQVRSAMREKEIKKQLKIIEREIVSSHSYHVLVLR